MRNDFKGALRPQWDPRAWCRFIYSVDRLSLEPLWALESRLVGRLQLSLELLALDSHLVGRLSLEPLWALESRLQRRLSLEHLRALESELVGRLSLEPVRALESELVVCHIQLSLQPLRKPRKVGSPKEEESRKASGWDPEIEPKHMKSLPDGRQQGGATRFNQAIHASNGFAQPSIVVFHVVRISYVWA